MPSVLAIIPGTTLPRRVTLRGATIEIHTTLARALEHAERRTCDLLVLGPMPGDEQATAARQVLNRRRWRSVPVLYLAAEDALGIVVPSGYRPGIDSLAKGGLESPAVQKRVLEMCRGADGVEPVLVGPFELDPGRRRLRFDEGEISLTRKEAELLAVLMSRPNETVTAGELITQGWSVEFDPQALQTLRRHVSNLRHKLNDAAADRVVRTVRGQGYRFVPRKTG